MTDPIRQYIDTHIPEPLTAEEVAKLRALIAEPKWPFAYSSTVLGAFVERLLATLDAAQEAYANAVMERDMYALDARAPLDVRQHLDFCSGGEFCTMDDCLCECHVVPAPARHRFKPGGYEAPHLCLRCGESLTHIKHAIRPVSS